MWSQTPRHFPMGKRRIVRDRFPATAVRASRRMRRPRLQTLPPRRPLKPTVRRDQQLARVWLIASFVLLPAGHHDRLTNDRPKQRFLQSKKCCSRPAGNSGKNGNCPLLLEVASVLSGRTHGPSAGLEQNIPRELVLIAAPSGRRRFPNETIYPGGLHRGGACCLGDGRIRNAARSRKRDY